MHSQYMCFHILLVGKPNIYLPPSQKHLALHLRGKHNRCANVRKTLTVDYVAKEDCEDLSKLIEGLGYSGELPGGITDLSFTCTLWTVIPIMEDIQLETVQICP